MQGIRHPLLTHACRPPSLEHSESISQTKVIRSLLLTRAMTCIPAQSIRPQNPVKHRMSLPVVDFTHLEHNFAGRSQAIDNLGRICQRLGAFQVKNHGISASIINGALEAGKEFFNMSTKIKAEFESDDIRKPVRYTNAKEGLNVSRSFIKHYAHPLREWSQSWPVAPVNYRENVGAYSTEARRVALRLMDAIVESLGLGTGFLKDKFDDGMQLMVINSYPYNSASGPSIGMAPHSDFGFITILLQTCQGLEVMDGGDWGEVPYIPETLHVHIGDHLEVLGNGRYKGVVHRAVLNPAKDRISIASIHGFSMDENVTTAKELIDEKHPSQYKESSFNDFLNHLCTVNYQRNSYIDSLKIASP